MSLMKLKKNSPSNHAQLGNKQFPLIERSTFHPKSNHKKFSSLDFRLSFTSHRRCESIRKQRSITNESKEQSYLERLKSKENENELKMEKSVLKFKQKQNFLFKTTMQKKKQKKMFSVQNLRNEEMQFFNSLQRHNLTKQDTVQEEHTFRQFPLRNIPSVCYDSQFVHQREGSCLTILNGRLYLFGGAIRRKFSYLPENESKANIDILFHSYDDDRWIRQPVSNQVSSDKKNLIHHSVNSVNKKYILIAGGMMGDSQKTLSKFNHAILVYNTETKKMCEIPWEMSIRSHASSAFCSSVVLHGGKNEEGQVLNQLHMLTMNTNVLTPYSSSDNRSHVSSNVGIRTWKFQTNQPLVNHAMISTLDQEKSFRIGLRQNNGLIVFGGENGDGKMDNHLKIMKVYSSSQLERKLYKGFELIKTYGQPPCPRKCHSMNLIASKNSIVIMGGIDQKCNPLADIFMLDLVKFKWSRIETDPSIDFFFGGIHYHSTVSTNTCLYIFGGKYVKDVGNSNFLKIDFNFDAFQKKIRDRKGSEISKGCSLWSIAASSKQHLGTSDKILYDD